MSVWIFGSWGLFFLGMTAYLIVNYLQVGMAGKVALAIGVLNLVLLAIAALWQAWIQWQHWKRIDNE